MAGKVPVLKVWKTDTGLEIQMLKASENKYLMLGLLEEIRYNIVSGNVEETEDEDPPMPSGDFDA